MHRNTMTRLAVLEGLLMQHIIETLDDDTIPESERLADTKALHQLKTPMDALRYQWMVDNKLLPAPEGFPEGYETVNAADCCEHGIPRVTFCGECHLAENGKKIADLDPPTSGSLSVPAGGPLALPCGCYGRCTLIHGG